MSAFIDLTNNRFGRLLVLKRRKNDQSTHAVWKCVCDCQTTTTVTSTSLRSGNTKSCGCLRRDKIRKARTTHGMSSCPEYFSFKSAKARCRNAKNSSFKNYGARGIKFLFRSFEDFFAELGVRPKGTSLDRINNNGHYKKGNVRWTTRRKQNNNRRNVRKAA